MKYKIIFESDWLEAKKLADNGWELVSVTVDTAYDVSQYRYYFKRPVQ